MENGSLGRLQLRARGLAVLRGVLRSRTARDLLSLIEILDQREPDAAEVADTFGRLWEGLALEPDRLLPDAWQSHLVGRLLDDENPFSLNAERGTISSATLEQGRRDLSTLRALFDLDAPALISAVGGAVPGLSGLWVPWTDTWTEPWTEPDSGAESPRHTIARKLAAAERWEDCAELLAGHYRRHGAGVFGRHRAFRWAEGRMRVVDAPDPARLSGFVGYEREREPLIRNTERFLAGFPAHHALLYGLPGTGKSSTVKAILNEYADHGLRLVEVAKQDLPDLPRVLEVLRGRGPRFILFVDDLSFEEHEIEYKALKALLEGSVAEPPENVRVYATSNRRNIVRESFSEREGSGSADDVHASDTMQEKLSLAARFGLRVTFPPPDRRLYQEIVAGIARGRGLEIPDPELAERAARWDQWHAGRSGRTARQFVDDLEAELADRGEAGR